MSSLIISLSLLFYSYKSQQGCVPANTCFDVTAGNTDSSYDSSVKFTCENQIAYRQSYEEGGCQTGKESALPVPTTEIYGGDPVSSSSSPPYISSDHLQGVGCRVLKNPSEQCQHFMVLKHRGNKFAQEGYYLNIGDNCSAYIGNEQTFTKYSTLYMPIGCVEQVTGSTMYTCDANGWSYTKYEDRGCPPTGNTIPAQTKSFIVDKCGYFSQWIHCNNSNFSGCVGDGVHNYWWYWYDLDCCPVNGKTCCGAPSSGPTAINHTCQLTTTASPTSSTGSPTASPTSPTNSPTPTSPTNSPTASPTGTPTQPTAPTTPGTAKPTAPTTAAPTNIFGTSKPTTSAPTSPGTSKPTNGKSTNQPTTPGTAKPTAPTTGAPTDIFGTGKPTAPTTNAPTSVGTGKSTTRPTILPTGNPTDVQDQFEPCIDEFILFSGNNKIEISIEISIKTKKMNMILKGPNDKWFGIGFGGNTMKDTYVITVNEAIQERKLGDHKRGTDITNTFNSVENIPLSTKHIVSLIRDYKINNNVNAFDFTDFFNCNIAELNVIWAVGVELTFGYHFEKRSSSFFSCACNDTILSTVDEPSVKPTAKPSEEIFGNESLCLNFMYSVIIGIVTTILFL